MKTVFAIAVIVFAVLGSISTIRRAFASDEFDRLKWKVDTIQNLGFVTLFYLLFYHS